MYALRPGLHFCVVDGIVVFLDAPQDRYFGLSPTLSKTFLEMSQAVSVGCALDPARARLFLERGILIEDGKVATWKPSMSRQPRDEWQPDGSRPSLALLALAWACIAATLLRLRTHSFEQLIGSGWIRDATPRAQLPKRAVSSFLSALRLFPRRLDCLPASLSLRSYLARLSISSELVIAVSLKPFAAHCWIEVGDMVIGDTIERVRDYVPIRRLP